MQITDELKVVVEAEVERAIQNFERLNSGIDKNEKKTKSLSVALDTFSGKAAVISAAFGGAGVAAVKFAGNLEQTQIALEVLVGDAEKASRIKNEWMQLASATPFSSGDIDSAGKKLLAFNIEAGKVTDTLRRIGDISAATGSSISDIADIYGKAAVQGRLFAEDINQFQGRGIPIVQSLAKVLGVSESAVRTLVSEGKVGFGELEKAFQYLTDDGGQFSGMMERLSDSTLGRFSSTVDNAGLALASFGEIMLDSVNGALSAGDGFFRWLQDMDDGTKRFVITLAGVAAAAGPAVTAIKGITAAMAALAANPIILGAAGVTAGIALIAAAVNKANHAFEDTANSIRRADERQQELLAGFAKGDEAKKLDAKTTAELIRLYPELAGEIEAYKTSVSDAAEAVEKLNRQKILDHAVSGIQKLGELQGEYVSLQIQIQNTKEEIKNLNHAMETGEGVTPSTAADIKTFNDGLLDQYAALEKNRNKFDSLVNTINTSLSQIGKGLSDNWQITDLPDELIDPQEIIENIGGSLDAAAPSLKKTWQQWFEEVTGVSDSLFKSGKEAGIAYVQAMGEALSRDASIAEALGNEFDLHPVIQNQMRQIEGDIGKLLSIPAEEIDEQFSLADGSIQKLISSYHELDEVSQSLTVTETLEGLRGQVDNLGKSEADLTLEMLKANGASEQQIQEAQELLAQLNPEPIRGWQEALSENLEEALNKMGGWSEKTSAILAGLGTQLAAITFDSALGGLNELGKALAEGADASDSLQQALSSMAMQILNQLPMMFMQAGLQLIAQGQWALGLGLIAASGVLALTSGYVEGKMDQSKEEANAAGGVYGDDSYQAFAKGGAFTNSVVTSPTHFRFARGGKFGKGLMGEAGPEAIMPLKRGSDGSLGVAVSGGGFALQIVINNYTNEEVSAEEKTDMDGQRQLEITIGSMINQHITSGKADKSMKSRYGLKAQGV